MSHSRSTSISTFRTHVPVHLLVLNVDDPQLTHAFLESVCRIKPQGRDSNQEETRQSDLLRSPPRAHVKRVLNYRDSPGFFVVSEESHCKPIKPQRSYACFSKPRDMRSEKDGSAGKLSIISGKRLSSAPPTGGRTRQGKLGLSWASLNAGVAALTLPAAAAPGTNWLPPVMEPVPAQPV
ncbi:hypothetical protein MJG53_019047 [Ovis ammon polii x Ovis aries]|uniref:Uncharacterized protein n=1 Tax=Ovis ammon polii x Ovis aries TaxID=2918886 RepID=A0ACB9U3Q3_9CETA|nr:hypothetical protein MJG53_019047 [Ovis ammon polii x Ovis aries]